MRSQSPYRETPQLTALGGASNAHKSHEHCQGDVEATKPIHRMKTKVLERCTADEQALQILLPDADGNELEVLKFRKMKSARDIDPGENAPPKCSAVQRGHEAERGQRQ